MFGQLPPPAQRLFRLLVLYPGADFDALAVAAPTGLSPDDAEDRTWSTIARLRRRARCR